MTKPKASVKKAVDALHAYAMEMPEAWEDFPWGERVVKVKKKVFVFFGKAGDEQGFGVKLPESAEDALTLPYVEPAGYGLGKSGWVSVNVPAGKPPMDLFESWIEESYRSAAPKKLAKLLDEPPPTRAPDKKRKGKRAR